MEGKRENGPAVPGGSDESHVTQELPRAGLGDSGVKSVLTVSGIERAFNGKDGSPVIPLCGNLNLQGFSSPRPRAPPHPLSLHLTF